MKITAKKRFGQNFLVDNYIINKIIELINPKPSDTIVEIGPGMGALTKPLLNHLPTLDVIEIDRDIIQYLNNHYKDTLTIHNADALNFDFNSFNQNIRVVGNLPYNISTPLLFHLTKFSNIEDMHFMLQKEVVDRICSKNNCHDYGKLSIMLQYRYSCIKLLDAPPESFSPAPKVQSAIIRLKPKSYEEYQHVDEKKLNLVVTLAFNQRRKTIANSLKTLFNQDTLIINNIDIQKRAENLTIDEFILLSNLL